MRQSGMSAICGGLIAVMSLLSPRGLLARPAATSPDTMRIQSIAIVRLPVFPETTGTPLPWFLRLANHLHPQTHPSVIRREILFREGTPYDSLRASESERLLRGRGIFESVRITSRQDETGYVTTIRTQDLWTLGVDVNVQKEANISRLTLGIRDANILGTGNGIHWGHTFSSDRNSSVVSADIPRIGYTRSSASIAYAQSDDAISRFAAFSRPIETYFDRWSWDVAASDLRGDQRFFRAGIESGTSGFTREWGVAAIGHYSGIRRQAGFGGGWIYERASPRGHPRSFISGVPPPPAIEYLRLSGPLLYAGIAQRRFIQATNLLHYGVIEDVPLGWSANLAGAANADPSRDPDHAFAIRPVVNCAAGIGGQKWVASVEGVGLVHLRRSGEAGERVVRGNATLRWQPSPRALSIAQVGFHAASGQPAAEVFYLGTDSGLRGYPARALEAREYVVGTVEQRLWSGIEVLWVGFGGNLFADVARPVTTDGPNDTSWRFGLGGGLLLGFRKSAQPPLRIEVALRRDRRGEKPTLSITSDTWLRLVPQVSLPTLFRDLHSGLR